MVVLENKVLIDEIKNKNLRRLERQKNFTSKNKKLLASNKFLFWFVLSWSLVFLAQVIWGSVTGFQTYIDAGKYQLWNIWLYTIIMSLGGLSNVIFYVFMSRKNIPMAVVSFYGFSLAYAIGAGLIHIWGQSIGNLLQCIFPTLLLISYLRKKKQNKVHNIHRVGWINLLIIIGVGASIGALFGWFISFIPPTSHLADPTPYQDWITTGVGASTWLLTITFVMESQISDAIMLLLMLNVFLVQPAVAQTAPFVIPMGFCIIFLFFIITVLIFSWWDQYYEQHEKWRAPEFWRPLFKKLLKNVNNFDMA